MQTEFNLDVMMPAGRETEAPEVLTRDIIDVAAGADSADSARPAESSAALLDGRFVGVSPAHDGGLGPAAAPAAGEAAPAVGASSASTYMFAAAPSATTEDGVDDGDDGRTKAQEAESLKSHPALARGRFPKSVSSIRSTDNATAVAAAAAAERSTDSVDGPHGGGAISLFSAGPKAAVVESFYGRRDSAPIESSAAGGGDDGARRGGEAVEEERERSVRQGSGVGEGGGDQRRWRCGGPKGEVVFHWSRGRRRRR